MSRTRIVINVILVVILVGFLWILGRAWLRSNPDLVLSSAEQQFEEGDFASAKVNLMSFLRDVPESSAGHELMSKVLLKEAAAEGRPDDSLATNEEARDHLQKAARLAPDNVAIHEQLLDVFLDRGGSEAAAEVAEIVIEADPENSEALLALFRRSVAAGDFTGGEERLASLREHPSQRVFQQAQFEIEHFKAPEHAEQLAAALDDAVQKAENTTAEQLVAMSQTEQLAIPFVMQQAIAQAPDLKTAQHRASVALGICEKIAGSDLSNAAELSRFAADIMRVLRRDHPLNQASPELRQERRELEKRADVFLQAGMDSGTADIGVYFEAAMAAFDRRDHEEARGTLESAVARFRDLPPEREGELLTLKLLAARNLFVMRRYADAKPYLQALMDASDKNFAGWGALLSGAIASAEGRQQLAFKNYLLARQDLGQNPLVSMALANTHLQMRQWKEALPFLKYLEQMMDASDVEQQAWAQMYQMFSEQIHWNQFRVYVALDQWEEAEAQMEFLRGTSLEPRVEAVASLHLAEEEDNDAALERLAAARQRFPDDLTLLITQASLLARNGQSEEAMQTIEQLASREDLTSQIFLVRWRLRQNRPDEALEILTTLDERYPNNPLPKLLKARVLLALGKAEESLEISQQLRDSPQTARVAEYLELSQFLKENKLEEATEKLEQIEADAPTVTPRMNLLAGGLAAAQGELDTAIEKVGDTLDVASLQGQSRTTLLRALLVMAERDGPDKAAAKLAPLLERYPDDAFLRLMEADLQFKQGRFDDGLRALERVEALLPGRPTAAYIKASVYAQRGDVDRALAEAKRAVAIDPSFVNAQQLAATFSLAQGKFAEAAQYAAKALELNGRAWQLYLVLAEALQGAGRPQQAAETLEKAISAEPRFLAAYRGLAALHLANGRPDEARQVLQQAQQVAPDVFQLFVDEIAVLAQQKQLDEAEELARQSVGKPADVAKSLVVARTMLSVGQRDSARTWADAALQLADEEQKPACELLLGEIALMLASENDDRQLFEESRDHFAEVVKVLPNHFVAGNNLAWLLATEFEQPQEALAIVEKVRGDANVSQLPIGFIDTLAEVYRRAGRGDRALEMLQEAVDLYPQSGPILFHLGMALGDAGQTAAAVNNLERALQIGGLSDERKSMARDMLASLSATVQ